MKLSLAVGRWGRMSCCARESVVSKTAHRGHAMVEQVIADLKDSALTHLSSGKFHPQCRLAGPGRDRVRPHPRSRLPGQHLPRQGDHRQHPHSADHRARPTRPLRSPTRPAPTPQLALASRLDQHVHPYPRPTSPTGTLANPPNGPTETSSGKAGQTGPAPMPEPAPPNNPRNTPTNPHRWIRVQ